MYVPKWKSVALGVQSPVSLVSLLRPAVPEPWNSSSLQVPNWDALTPSHVKEPVFLPCLPWDHEEELSPSPGTQQCSQILGDIFLGQHQPLLHEMPSPGGHSEVNQGCGALGSPNVSKVMPFLALIREETALAEHSRHFLCYLRAPGEPLPPKTTRCLKKVGESKWTNIRKKESRGKIMWGRSPPSPCPLLPARSGSKGLERWILLPYLFQYKAEGVMDALNSTQAIPLSPRDSNICRQTT